jgi:hypothetical protein
MFTGKPDKPLQQDFTEEIDDFEETKEEDYHTPDEWDFEEMDVGELPLADDSLSNLPAEENMSGPPIIRRNVKRKAKFDPEPDGGTFIS